MISSKNRQDFFFVLNVAFYINQKDFVAQASIIFREAMSA